MRTPLILTTLLTVCAFAGAATAQATPQLQAAQTGGQTAGLRYLSWPGKVAPAPAPAVRTATAPTPVAAPAPPPVFEPVPLARIAPDASRPGLTPASAWLSPKPAAATSTAIAYALTPEPAPEAVDAPTPQPQPQPQPQPRPRPAPQPETASVPEPAPVSADPMAPRADAPIFRLQRPVASPATASAEAAAPAWSAPRYYSLHRQAGHEPDPIAMPQAVYLDALPVELAQTPQSADLAEPPAAPSLMRNADGRLVAAPQIEGDALP